MKKAIRFVDFCADLLKLRLSRRQRVLALVAIDGVDPIALDEADRTIARELFGDVDEVPPGARRVQAWRLGRGSGKTTLSAALAIYQAVTADLSRCGPGDEPAVVIIAPRLRTARLSVRMARALMRAHPSLERLVVKGDDSKDGFTLRRTDGRRVAIAAFPASKGGAAARGISIVGLTLDEAEFFSSEDAAVTDRDVFTAIVPRLLPEGRAIFISTPWPVPTLMGEVFEKNFANPTTALAALGTTSAMRDHDPAVVAHVEAERVRDFDTAAREFDCVDVGGGATGFFDPASVDDCIDDDLVIPEIDVEALLAVDDHELKNQPGLLLAGESGGAGGDLGLSRDSSALAVVGRKAKLFRLAAIRELRPQRGAALKLSAVIRDFAGALRAFRLRAFAADAYVREPAREWTAEHRITIVDAPEGNAGKVESYLDARTLFRERRIRIPRHPRLVAQLKGIVSKPLEGGGLKITSPRRAGLAHGDLVSALVLACWHAPSSGGLLIPRTTARVSYRFGTERGF